MAEKNGRAGGILGDFSVSQIIATGLAAATSFALSAQIGIAGSIIGAVIGAVASSVATQVYRNILSASAEKLRALGPDQTARPEEALREGETRVMPSADAARARAAVSGTPIAPPELSEAARSRERALLARRVAVFAAFAAIVVVLAYALVVSLATRGAGIGPSLAPSAPATVEEQDGPAAPEAPAEQEAPQQEPEGTSDTNEPTSAPDGTDPAEGGDEAPTQPDAGSDDDASAPETDADPSSGDDAGNAADGGADSPDTGVGAGDGAGTGTNTDAEADAF